jgi:outer membrane protein OmpA-like peptidoglycan-associated protein
MPVRFGGSSVFALRMDPPLCLPTFRSPGRSANAHRRAPVVAALLLGTAGAAAAASTHAAGAPRIPLCPGLTIVTAVSQLQGDYESIKTIESVGTNGIELKYSAEGPDPDAWVSAKPGPPPLKTVNLHRTVLSQDLASADAYQQTYLEKSAQTIPGTTAIGTSAAVLRALETTGEARLSISNTYYGLELGADRSKIPNYYSYLQQGTLKRVGSKPVPIAVIVNDRQVELPAIQAEWESTGTQGEFLFLEDERNPLALQFRIGIGEVKPLDPQAIALCDHVLAAAAQGKPVQMPYGLRCDMAHGGDRDTLRVTKIAFRCVSPESQSPRAAHSGGGAAAGGSAAAAGTASALEQALASQRKADVYSIYFSFNSDQIRKESEPTLAEIAGIMRRHPDWKLEVNGHTDAVGGDAYNLDLSRRRAAAVKAALITRYAIARERLTTSGFGRSQPKDTNDTLEGRAHNRRVELVRL